MKTQNSLLKKTLATAGVVLFFFVIAFIGGVMGTLCVQLVKDWLR